MNTALIWGANGGIGRALTSKLARQQWTVIAVARNSAQLSTLTPHTLDADVESLYDVEVAVQAAGRMVEEVNLWIYAVGDIAATKVVDMMPAEWQRILGANLTGAFAATHYSLPLLATDAHLFYIGAISERLRLPGLAAYSAAKAGLEAFTETLSKEQRPRKVTIVRPGAVDTALWDKVPLRLPRNAMTADDVAERILQAYEQGTIGTLDLP